jgi:hypothetical protein
VTSPPLIVGGWSWSASAPIGELRIVVGEEATVTFLKLLDIKNIDFKVFALHMGEKLDLLWFLFGIC